MQNMILVKGEAETAHMSTIQMNRLLNQNGSEQWMHKYNGKTIKDRVELSVNQLQEFIKAVDQ